MDIAPPTGLSIVSIYGFKGPKSTCSPCFTSGNKVVLVLAVDGAAKKVSGMPASMGADTKEKTHHLVKDLLSYTLTKNNIRVEGFVSNPSPTNLQTHVRWSVEALVDDSSELFTNLGEQLHITHENIEVTFIGIANEIFATGINWGRIVAFLAFGGAVSTYCASKEDLIAEVDHVAVWMTDYIDENLRDWIEKEGGWVRIRLFKRFVVAVEVLYKTGTGRGEIKLFLQVVVSSCAT